MAWRKQLPIVFTISSIGVALANAYIREKISIYPKYALKDKSIIYDAKKYTI